MPVCADVLISAELSAQDAAELTAVCTAFGIISELRQVAARRSLNDIAWLALVALPLKPFYEQLAKEFATDAHRRLKDLTSRILNRVRERDKLPSVLLLQDTASGIRVALEPDLPDEAFRQLLVLDLAAAHTGLLQYDRRRHQWRSDFD